MKNKLIYVLLAALLNFPVAAQQRQPAPQNGELTENAVFVLRQGGDVVSTEWHSRTARRATGAVVVNESEEFSYTLDIDPQGLASRYEMITPQPGKAPLN